MKLAVVTTTYNRPEHFRLFLAALAAQDAPPDEVLVADDGSDAPAFDAIRTLAAAAPFPVRVFRQPHDGYRLAAARNLAFANATADYAVCIDCDIALLPGALAVHRRLAAPRTVVIANRAILPEEPTRRLFGASPSPAAADWEDAWRLADFSEAENALRAFRKQALLRRFHLARPHKPKVIGCHFALHLDDIRRVNGFDENFVGWGYEDDDFGRRLYLAGLRPVSAIAEARALHLWHPSLAPQRLRRHRDRPNRAYFYRRGVRAWAPNGIVKSPSPPPGPPP